MLIEGDNYHALSVLNYTHAGKIDVIYIDPPYNTGNKDFVFNDHYIDKEDGYRHSMWLSFMEKRLKLAKNLLKNDGVIFISIDDNEVAQLKLLMDNSDLFGEDNTEIMIWQKTDFTDGVLKITKRFRTEHEYIIVCYKNKTLAEFNKVLQYSQIKNEYGNPDNDQRGPWISTELGRSMEKSRKDSPKYYAISSPNKKKSYRQWLFTKEEMDTLIKDGRVYFGKNGDAVPRLKKFVNEKRYKAATSIIRDFGSARVAMEELDEIFGGRVFNYPKPTELIIYLLNLLKEKDIMVLDFFVGSGTTGEAVLELNKEDGGNRKFILCTNNELNGLEKELREKGMKESEIQERGICRQVCYPRIEKVINGYKNSKGEKVEGLGGNLKYYKTEFVDYKNPNDKNKIKLTKEAVEMLCVKEETFELVQDSGDFKIFKNHEHYTGIIFDQLVIKDFKKAIRDIKSKFSVYVFSLGDDSFDEEFEDIKQKVRLSPIPEAILKVYRRIFK
ncbi:site-specific DNA-methyltransferase [Patescibacteria group bacterium]|nr:site-specific DNA-methyltransferase [Patescibacteria group bacterium]